MDTPQNTNPSNKLPTTFNSDVDRLAAIIITKAKEQFNEGLEMAATLHDKVKAGYKDKESSPVIEDFIELHNIFAKAIRDLKLE
jgi:hypothetical protein